MCRAVTVIVIMAAIIFCFHISIIGIIVVSGGVGVMRNFSFSRIGLSLLLLMMGYAQAWAQTALKDISVNYGMLRLDKGYSIIYDNPNEAAKLNEFKIKFYRDRTFIDETVIESFPSNGTITPYDLTDPIIGFNRAELSILSLHSGDIESFPSSAGSIIALNEATEINLDEGEATSPDPVNLPPLASDAFFQIEATTETVTRSFADQFSDPDNDPVAVVNITKTGPHLSYAVSSEGTLTLSAPSITGGFKFPYVVKDSQGASASAEIHITIVVPETLGAKLAQYEHSLAQLLSQISEQETKLEKLNVDMSSLIDRRENLLADNKALETQLSDPKLSDIKNELVALTKNLEASKNMTSVEDLNTRALALQSELETLQLQQAQNGLDVASFQTEIDSFGDNLDNLLQEENTLEEPAFLTALQMDKWEAQHQKLLRQVSTFNERWLLVILLILGAIVALILRRQTNLAKTRVGRVEATPHNIDGPRGFRWLWFPRRLPPVIPNPPQPPNIIDGGRALPPRLEISIREGLIIGGGKASVTSQALATGNVAPAFLEDFQQSYNAIGRVGLPFGAEDQRSCGTGVLITPHHIMTNAHVYDFLYEYGQPGEFGIEFMAEHGNPASSHYEFKDSPPLILEGFDIAIFTLRTPIDSRLPAVISPTHPQDLEEREIALIGYPSSYSYRENDHFSGFEMFPVLDVKRVSYGSIFRHSQDEGPFGFRVNHHKARNTIISHNATSIGGGSGSPVIDRKTGQVLAIHFGGAAKPEVLEETDTEDADIEKANFSMPMSEICDALPEDISNLMTIR